MLSESYEEGEVFLYWVTKMSQYFEDKFFQISLNFWLSFASYFSTLIGLGMPLFYLPYLGSVRQEISVMIIKHHTYTHCKLMLYINTLYNVCSVHQGMFSTSGGGGGGVQYIGGCSVHRGGCSVHRGGCSVHRGDIMSTLGGYHEYIGGIS